MPRLCSECREASTPPRFPRHLVHPRDGTPQLWDTRGEALCPTCGARWRFNTDNTVEALAVSDDILPKIPGHYVALAVQGLPREDAPYVAVAGVEQDVPGFGHVCFTARRRSYSIAPVRADAL